MARDGFGDMGDLMKYAFFPSRQPPQVEKVDYNIKTQVVILLLQGGAVMLLVLIGMALLFALVVCEAQSIQPNGPFSGLDVAVVRVILCSLLWAGAAMAGVGITIKVNLQAGIFFMVLLAGLGLLVYQLVPSWATTAAWPWALLFGSISFNYGAHYTRRAFKEEIDDPAVRGMPASERTKQIAIDWMMKQAMAAAEPVVERPIEVTIEEDGRTHILYPHLSGTDGEKLKFAEDAVEDKLALGTTLPRTHPLWRETHARGLVVWRNDENHKEGQTPTAVGRHIFQRMLEEL